MDKLAIELLDRSISDVKEDVRLNRVAVSEKLDELCHKIDELNEKKIQPLHDIKNKFMGIVIACGLGGGFTGSLVKDLLVTKDLYMNNERMEIIKQKTKGEKDG